MSLRISRASRFIRKHLYELMSQTRWITLLKSSSMHYGAFKHFDTSCVSMAALCVASELSTDFILVEEFNSLKKKIQEEPQIGTTEPPPSRHPTTILS